MKKLSEASIIHFLSTDNLPPKNVLGIGDDAAVIHRDNKYELVTKDLLIEDQHFRLRYTTPEQLAKKALHVNLSDIAAMGGIADYIFLGLSIPATISPIWLESFLHHIKLQCQLAGVYLLGGDTTHSPHGLIISVTAIGHAEDTYIKYRTGAECADMICLLGFAGDAHAGFMLLENNMPDFEPLKECALSPTAFMKEGAWLGKQSSVTAMMDTSDGIYVDLKKICDASKVGAILNIETLPISPELIAACEMLGITPADCALVGGEDYGLLFTVKKEKYQLVKEQFKFQFDMPITVIGVITDTHHLELREKGKSYNCNLKPFSHFHENV